MELFARISYTYPAGDIHIENDNEINEKLNSKLIKYLTENSIKEYRIINAETSSLPTAAFGPGIASVICSLYIAYKKES
jgi:hypothetical protein